jgi:hypothetical protein
MGQYLLSTYAVEGEVARLHMTEALRRAVR